MTLVSVPSLAVVTTNVADGGGSISGVSGCEWQEQGALPTWMGMERKSEITCAMLRH